MPERKRVIDLCLSDILRDFKKFTALKVVNVLKNNMLENRKRGLLWLLQKRDKIILWREGYHGEEITSRLFYEIKERYIHLNPVRVGIVIKEEAYLYSSCPTRFGLIAGLLELSDFD